MSFSFNKGAQRMIKPGRRGCLLPMGRIFNAVLTAALVLTGASFSSSQGESPPRVLQDATTAQHVLFQDDFESGVISSAWSAVSTCVSEFMMRS